MTCPPLHQIAGYCLGEPTGDDAEALEEHYFSCAHCATRVERMQGLSAQLQGMLPHILTTERRKGLEATGRPLAVTSLGPGERATLTFGPGVEVGFWVLRAPVRAADRVDFELETADGAPLISISDVPFDAAREEVLLACKTAYSTLTPATELHARVVAIDPAGGRTVSEYLLDHVFDSP